MALNKIISEGIKDGEVKNADIAADAVDIADLSATGTASSSTFLRGDNTWATPTDTTTPADGTVTEAKLNANAPTNDNVLIADSSAAGGFKWGDAAAGAKGGGSDKIFWENGQTVTADYTITNNYNAGTFGPVTINSGVTVTVGDGEYLTII